MRYNKALLSDSDAVSFRLPLRVTEILLLENDDFYPICPRCNMTLEREYMRFCDRCGQKLDWRGFNKAIVRTVFDDE